MLKKSLFSVFVFIVLSLQTVFSQGLINGTVVAVIDGRTLTVLDSSDKKITVRLRYLETPEPEQPLFEIVKNHLKDLALGKKIFVTKVRLFDTYTLGVGVINDKTNNVDLSRQMIRDGAGWFDIFDADSSTSDSTGEYQATELVAKGEKRGVWGIPEMKTPWDFRDERDGYNNLSGGRQKLTFDEKSISEMSLADLVKKSSGNNLGNGLGKLAIYNFEYKKPANTSQSTGYLSSADSGNINAGDINQLYDARYNRGFVATRPLVFTIQNGKTSQKLALVFGYNYYIENSRKVITQKGLVVVAKMGKTAFLRGKNIGLVLDNGTRLTIGYGKYAALKTFDAILFDNVDSNQLLSMSSSSSVTLLIGKNQIAIDSSFKQTINNFLNTLK
jgi:endonuclease YncB( thermonuclease family)